ncbi:FAD-dependent oxidoreductase [bacterium]|nr:FAD-dependent oxidoreductase [bacterium]
MRIVRHPILDFPRQNALEFIFDGKKIAAFEGETIAAALHAAGVRKLSESAHLHRPRGFFCAIGKCSSCLMEVNGIPNVKTCLTLVELGMVVRSQRGWGTLHSVTQKLTPTASAIPAYSADIAIIGGGPSGLSAAIESAKLGLRVMLFDENHRLGGQLIKQTHMFFGSKEHYARIRGIEISRKLQAELQTLPVEVFTEASVIGYYHPHSLAVIHHGKLKKVTAKKVIVTTGATENMLAFEGNDLPGIYGAGAVQTLMNVHGVLPGKRVLMIGAGNIGVIVSYQLLQAGVDVAAIVEAKPSIGAYQVHASKIARMGVPILTSCTLKRAWGNDCVTNAEIVDLDKNWREIPGTEKEFDIDTICLSVGLNPSSKILAQAGAKMQNIPALGGNVAFHGELLETTVAGLYVAGDVSGIEEASSAMLEGRLAGIAAGESLLGRTDFTKKRADEIQAGLVALRTGPFGARTRAGNQELKEGWLNR